MNGWEWGALAFVAVWLAGALFTAGLVWEREHLLENPTLRSASWWGGYVLMALAWPWAVVLWPSSRPVPPQPPGATWPDDYRGRVRIGGQDVVDLVGADRPAGPTETLASYVWADQPGAQEAAGIIMVDKPHSLAVCGRVQPGQKVYVKSLASTLTRQAMYWVGECGCRYNFSGFPVVMCRVHRSDVDPQGEPDEDEGSVGL